MARCLSHVWSIARGSVAGITYTANQWHQIIMRARTSPVQPNTNNQSTMRAAFAACSALWLGLSSAIRSDWNIYSQTCVFSGPLGSYSVPGRQMFTAVISLGNYIVQKGLLVGMTIGTSAPVIPGFYNVGSVSEGISLVPQTGICVDVNNQGGETIAVFAQRSGPFNATRLRYKGPWDTSTDQCISLATATVGKVLFAGLTVGKVYFVRVKCMTKAAPHRMSTEYMLRCTAILTP